MPSINDNLAAGFADLNPTVDAIAADLATVAAAPTIARLDTIIALLEAQEVEIPATSSFPAEPSVGDKVFYIPQGAVFMYDGDYWRGPRIYQQAASFVALGYTGVAPFTLGYIPTSLWGGVFYCDFASIMLNVLTTNNGTNYWEAGISNTLGAAIAVANTSGQAVGAVTQYTVAVNALLPTAGAMMRITNKVGAPGALYVAVSFAGHMRIPA